MPILNLEKKSLQTRMYEEPIDFTFLKKNRLFLLEKEINWKSLEMQIEKILQVKNNGRPRHPSKVMIALLMLQMLDNKYDIEVVETLSENIAWQYFCGCRYLSEPLSVSERSICGFRAEIGEEGLNVIMQELLQVGVKIGLVKKKAWKPLSLIPPYKKKIFNSPTKQTFLKKPETD